MLLLFWNGGTGVGAAAPSITLRLAAVGNPFATATPSITLSFLASTSAEFGSQASPSIQLALVGHAIGGSTVAGSTVIELEYNATGSTYTISHRTGYEQTGVSTIVLRLNE